MANPQRGEAAIRSDGQEYTLAFNHNALCILEDRFDKPISEIGQRLQAGIGVRDLRTILWVGLRKHHGELTEEQVGEIMDGMGGLEQVGEALGKAMAAAFARKGRAEGEARAGA